MLLVFATSCSSGDDGDPIPVAVDEGTLMNYGWHSDNARDLLIYDSDYPDINYTKGNVTLFFLGNGRGIIRQTIHSYDTSLGNDLSITPWGFSYTIHNGEVTVTYYSAGKTEIFRLSGDCLVSDGEKLTKVSINSSDRTWIEENKYKALPDKERLDFEYFCACKLNTTFSPQKNGSQMVYPVNIGVGIEADQHPWERGITSISATFTITGGSFVGDQPRLSAYPQKGKGCEASKIIWVQTKSEATVKMKIKIYDSVTKKDMEYTHNYTITGSDIDDPKEDDEDDNPDSGGIGEHKNHKYVDLGLSVKWATCNIGATNPEESGGYYAWGETTTKSYYQIDSYKWSDYEEWYKLTKYCTDTEYGIVDNKIVLDSSDDVAHVKWGGNWRMPTSDEYDELIDNCTWTWTSQNGVEGTKVTSKKNGNSIFLPGVGYYNFVSRYLEGQGLYWSSSLNPSDPSKAYFLYFYESIATYVNYEERDKFREQGCPVRAVCP